MANLYTNECFRFTAVLELRRLGHDVLTIFEHGYANAAVRDDEVLKFAAREMRVLVTLNRRDFIRLHNQNSTHCGIIVCTSDTDDKALTARIDQELKNNFSFAGKLIRVNRL